MTARPPKTPRPPLLTVAQAADILGVDPRQIYHWISQGVLGCTRYPTRNGDPGGPVRLEPADVEDFRTRYRQQAAT